MKTETKPKKFELIYHGIILAVYIGAWSSTIVFLPKNTLAAMLLAILTLGIILGVRKTISLCRTEHDKEVALSSMIITGILIILCVTTF